MTKSQTDAEWLRKLANDIADDRDHRHEYDDLATSQRLERIADRMEEAMRLLAEIEPVTEREMSRCRELAAEGAAHILSVCAIKKAHQLSKWLADYAKLRESTAK